MTGRAPLGHGIGGPLHLGVDATVPPSWLEQTA